MPGLSWRGLVERFDPLAGIEGWALAEHAPDAPVELELTVGGDAFALAATYPDFAEFDGRPAGLGLPGFRFPPEIFTRLAKLSARRRSLPVAIRVAGTDAVLATATGRLPSVGELASAWRRALLGAAAAPEPRITKGDRLLARLAAFRAEAEATALLPLRPFSDNEIGQIEALHLAGEGQVWFVGWMKRGAEPEFPAVILDRQKYPAGIAILQYERADLPASAIGVIGLMETGWAPPPAARDGFVYVGRQGQYHLRYGAQTKLLRAEALHAAFAQVQPVALGPVAEALGQLVGAGSNWLPGNAAAAGMVAEGGIDRLLMLPGFGCLAEGWAVSPAKRIETFHLKLGDCAMIADEASTAFRPRPDLQPVFGAASVTARAGFVAALRGALPANATGAPLLRIVHDDGSMAVQRVEPKALRRLDLLADGEEVLRLFPALRHEPFYPAFLDAARRRIDERTREPAPLFQPAPALRVLVLRLPGEPANLRLAFDQLARRLPSAPAGTGVALVADQGPGRGEAKLLFRELQDAVAAPLSLFGTSHEEDILGELPFILEALGAERFVHVGRGLVPTGEGWDGAMASLTRRGHGLDRFEIVDDTGRPDRVDGALSSVCFGWSTVGFLGWSRRAPRFLRGAYRFGGLPRPAPGDRVIGTAAIRLERPRPARLADMIDEDLMRMSGEGGL
ncbi:hypothetical protein GCM10011390_17290 [Aureimonas endophytica]|uniref:Uncharacterized protein n=1 Tax=Aureimonas endophytica TaxID=2027858 RepID=A0A916ZI36_9HYPH|nr:hypothetical protein GCM10011390_17290 [Aureimonas endophytica]